MPCIVAVEPWTRDLWAEMRPLAEAHFEEVDGGVEPNRPFRLALPIMDALAAAGVLFVVTAREAGRLIGYFTWNLTTDVESEGLIIGQQGAWFVEQGHPRAAAGMFDASVAELRRRGARCIYPHHRVQGRGSGIGRFFARRGAKLIQHTYSLWIGERVAHA